MTSAPKPIERFVKASDGLLRLGGAPPEGLVLPEFEFQTGLHFIGNFRDWPLLFPLFSSHQAPLFLDVIDPVAPIVIPRAETALFDLSEPGVPQSLADGICAR